MLHRLEKAWMSAPFSFSYLKKTSVQNWHTKRTFRFLDYLDSHQYLLLVRWKVVTFSQKYFSKCSFSKFSLQHDVVPLYVLYDWTSKNRGSHLNVGDLGQKHCCNHKICLVCVHKTMYSHIVLSRICVCVYMHTCVWVCGPTLQRKYNLLAITPNQHDLSFKSI